MSHMPPIFYLFTFLSKKNKKNKKDKKKIANDEKMIELFMNGHFIEAVINHFCARSVTH